jgi:hypothetical protein
VGTSYNEVDKLSKLQVDKLLDTLLEKVQATFDAESLYTTPYFKS